MWPEMAGVQCGTFRLESGMIRLASFFALACLALAATALLTTSQSPAAENSPRENDYNPDMGNRLAVRTVEHTVPFHARFSLN
jgi:hypothetical protein